jgi:hypothetical protein
MNGNAHVSARPSEVTTDSDPSLEKGGIVVFRLAADSTPVTTEGVRRIEAGGA